MTRATRQAEKRGVDAPAAAPLGADTAALGDLTRRATVLYAERDPLAAARAIGDGCRGRSRGGRVSIASQMIERLFRNDPARLDECRAYLSRLRVQRPAA